MDPSHKSHNASSKYPIMHYFVTEMCTYVQISDTKWYIVGMAVVNCGICEMDLLNTQQYFYLSRQCQRSQHEKIQRAMLHTTHSWHADVIGKFQQKYV